MDDCFIPECYIDTMLIETIAPPGKSGYNHQKGCGTVTKVMKEKFVDRFAVGIIDKDKREVDYLNEFFTITKNDSLLLHKHNNRHHYIIQINPAMERFIMKSADDVGISLANFNLPTNLGSFSKVSKTINTKKDHRFKQLFWSLFQEGAPDILQLADWINYLKREVYHADPNMLMLV